MLISPVCTSKQFHLRKMTDSLNFGPEWIRNLSSDGNISTSQGSKYQLAEFRYGREEMLALFEKGLRAPDPLSSFSSLYVEHTQLPLALIPMTEDENRLWQSRPAPPIATRGRGGSLERGGGRGRGGRGGTFHQGYGRPPYDESIRPYERQPGWQERNGVADGPEWAGAGSGVRKELGPRIGGVGMDNWRRHRLEEDSEGWRNSVPSSNKWSSRSSSWREGDPGDERYERERPTRTSWHSGENSHISGSRVPGGAPRRPWEMSSEDHLPEWATENLHESGGSGSFDSSGAFHGNSAEDEHGSRGVQKSSSQHNIPNRVQHSPLHTSQSAHSLSNKTILEKSPPHLDREEREHSVETPPFMQKSPERQKVSPPEKEKLKENGQVKREEQPKSPVKKMQEQLVASSPTPKISTSNGISTAKPEIFNKKNEDEFDRMQEVADDLVAKLMLDDETPKNPLLERSATVPLPPSSIPTPTPDKWYYRDPQGDVQGPFSASDMADWYRAGYFSVSLLVKRQCDERFFTLGDLVKLCMTLGTQPFDTSSVVRLPPVIATLPAVPKPPVGLDSDALQRLQQMQLQQQLQQQLLLRQTMALQALSQTDPSWTTGLSTLQQRELIAQHILTQPPIVPESPYINPQPNTNPLMQMINQMQQANKLPQQPPQLPQEPPKLDPIQQIIQQMGGLQQPQPTPQVVNHQPDDSIKTFLRQFSQNQQQQQQQQQQPVPPPETFWNPNFSVPTTQPQQPWTNNVTQPIWEQPQPVVQPPEPPKEEPPQTPQKETIAAKKEEEEKQKIKQKKQEEENQKKKQVQLEKEKKKQEAEKLKKQQEAEEKKREEAERRQQKKLTEEKSKKEAEEKRLRELEEKRRLKEQRKAEEEARKKAEEDKKKAAAEEEKRKKEQEKKVQEEQARRQQEALRKMQESQQQQQQQRASIAPWCNAETPSAAAATLAEIQKAEKERRAAELALQQARKEQQAAQAQALEQQQAEKKQMQLKWASKVAAMIPPKKVKSLAEIQAEEQERLAKQAAEARLAQQKVKKEQPVTQSVGIWESASQSLTWGGQNSGAGFWDDSPVQQSKPAPQPTKSQQNKTPVSNKNQSTKVPSAAGAAGKTKKKGGDEPQKDLLKLCDTNGMDLGQEFSSWCSKALALISSDVHIPTFIGFLMEIESPYEVKDYVRTYLGEGNSSNDFARQFLERRSKAKARNRAALQHIDDMCVPAPAVNPSNLSNSEFQEVKGKAKKVKKSRMMKVDARILGFSVTAAQDRINVGDRDYGDNA